MLNTKKYYPKKVSNLSTLPSCSTFSSVVAQSCCFFLYSIVKIRSFLLVSLAKSLAHIIIISHFNYCNLLLSSLPLSHLGEYISIQNVAAKIAYLFSNSAMPPFICLNWLPGTLLSNIINSMSSFSKSCCLITLPSFHIKFLPVTFSAPLSPLFTI